MLQARIKQRKPFSLAGLSRALTALTLGALGIMALAASPPVGKRPMPPPAIVALEDDALTRQIGQLVMVGFSGQTTTSRGVRRMLAQMRDGRIGGVLLFGRNIASRRQVEELAREVRLAAGELPPLIAVDQEGGQIQRLGPAAGYARYPSAAGVARTLDPAAAEKLYASLAGELSATGITVNLGPVVDLDLNRSNRVIGGHGRSFGSEPSQVIAYAKAFIDAHRQAHVLTAAKHFPGHGSSRGDSHLGFVDIGKTWSPAELEPYRALTGRDGANMVMVGHLHLPALGEGSDLPATLSKRAIVDMLRNQLGFAGVVITDDMEMGAIRSKFSFAEGIIAAVNAGNDILLFGNLNDDPDLPEKVIAVIRKAVLDGAIPLSRIEEAGARVAALRRTLIVPPPASMAGQLGR